MPDANTPSKPKISVQLYSVHTALTADRKGTFEQLAAIGLTTVEAFDFVANPADLARELADVGLTASTGHAMFLSDGNPQLTVLPLTATLEAAATLGLTYLIDPFVEPSRWKSRDEIARTADRMNEAAAAARGFGIELGYHNHGHELATYVDDRPALEVFADLVDPGVRFEVDLYWAAVGGVEPAGLVERLGDRVVAVHVKDGALGADPMALVVPDGQTAAGHGEVRLAEALDAADAVRFAIIEFDSYDGDIFEGIRGSYGFLAERGLR